MTTSLDRSDATAVGVRLSSTALAAEAGGLAELGVTIRNYSAVVDHLRVELLGPAASWAQLAPAVVGLFPGDEAAVRIVFSPPRIPGLLLEEVPFAVKVTSESDPARSAVEEGVVQIGAFRDVAAELQPRTVAARRTARFNLLLENRGNSPAALTLAGDDPESLLELRMPEQVVVGAGATEVVRVRAVAEKRVWAGRDRARPFSIQTQVEGEQPTVLRGTFVHRPMLSRRVWMALVALVALAVLWFAVLQPTVRASAIRQAELALAANPDIAKAGPAGPAGRPGSVGPDGPLGPGGSAGPAGQKGADGGLGPAGPGGAAGGKGADGSVGPVGAAGAAGTAGANGSTGAQGAPGNDGARGVAGVAGVAGAAGAAGAQGSDGSPGTPGSPGEAGSAGQAGVPGPRGEPGLNGASSAFSNVRAIGPGDARPGPGFTTVLTQTVPQGFYVFLAKTVLVTSSSTGSDCILTYDVGAGEVEVDRSNQWATASASARVTHNLQRLLQFGTSGATIRLQCRAGEVWGAQDSQVLAIQVQHAVDRSVTG